MPKILSPTDVIMFRQRLCDLALKAFAERGLDGISLRGLAAEAGCSRTTPYRYFKNKEALLQAIIEDVISSYDAELAHESKQFPDSPPKRFKAFLRYMMADARRPDVQAFFYQFWGLSTHNAQAAELRRAMYEHFLEQTKELLLALNPDMPEKELGELALTIIANLEGLHVVYGSSRQLLQQHSGFDELIYRQILRNVGIADDD